MYMYTYVCVQRFGGTSTHTRVQALFNKTIILGVRTGVCFGLKPELLSGYRCIVWSFSRNIRYIDIVDIYLKLARAAIEPVPVRLVLDNLRELQLRPPIMLARLH